MNIAQIIEMIDPEIYKNLTSAIELGKWPNGVALSQPQRELCMQAIIAYDVKHKPEAERVGYVANIGDACGNSKNAGETETRPVKLPDH
ncbi:MAG: DUF1315 domain-containing protein [Gammaproteobacteria bacterium]|nr:MAG: DUF1315 domain-containing protein [Gammaproteobacteria bacterium]RLA53346.1 MAG: DUF1315 domain-containing protein [Gammaproteobacteria bacterium]